MLSVKVKICSAFSFTSFQPAVAFSESSFAQTTCQLEQFDSGKDGVWYQRSFAHDQCGGFGGFCQPVPDGETRIRVNQAAPTRFAPGDEIYIVNLKQLDSKINLNRHRGRVIKVDGQKAEVRLRDFPSQPITLRTENLRLFQRKKGEALKLGQQVRVLPLVKEKNNEASFVQISGDKSDSGKGGGFFKSLNLSKFFGSSDKEEVKEDGVEKGAIEKGAIEMGSYEDTKALLTRRNINVNKQDTCGKTELLAAVKQGSLGRVRAYLEHEDTDVNLPDGLGITPLMKAAEKAHESPERNEIFNLLLDSKRIDIDFKSFITDRGETLNALQLAIEKKLWNEVLTLLQKGAKAAAGERENIRKEISQVEAPTIFPTVAKELQKYTRHGEPIVVGLNDHGKLVFVESNGSEYDIEYRGDNYILHHDSTTWKSPAKTNEFIEGSSSLTHPWKMSKSPSRTPPEKIVWYPMDVDSFRDNIIWEKPLPEFRETRSQIYKLLTAQEFKFPVVSKPIAYYQHETARKLTIGRSDGGHLVIKFDNSNDELPLSYQDDRWQYTKNGEPKQVRKYECTPQTYVVFGQHPSLSSDTIPQTYFDRWNSEEAANAFEHGGSPPQKIALGSKPPQGTFGIWNLFLNHDDHHVDDISKQGDGVDQDQKEIAREQDKENDEQQSFLKNVSQRISLPSIFERRKTHEGGNNERTDENGFPVLSKPIARYEYQRQTDSVKRKLTIGLNENNLLVVVVDFNEGKERPLCFQNGHYLYGKDGKYGYVRKFKSPDTWESEHAADAFKLDSSPPKDIAFVYKNAPTDVWKLFSDHDGAISHPKDEAVDSKDKKHEKDDSEADPNASKTENVSPAFKNDEEVDNGFPILSDVIAHYQYDKSPPIRKFTIGHNDSGRLVIKFDNLEESQLDFESGYYRFSKGRYLRKADYFAEKKEHDFMKWASEDAADAFKSGRPAPKDIVVVYPDGSSEIWTKFSDNDKAVGNRKYGNVKQLFAEETRNVVLKKQSVANTGDVVNQHPTETASRNMLNYPNRHPFFSALKSGQKYLVEEFLKDEELDINAPNCEGRTPLMIAAEHAGDDELSDRYKIFEMLLNHKNIDIDMKNSQGVSALTHATSKKSRKAVLALLKKNAKTTRRERSDIRNKMLEVTKSEQIPMKKFPTLAKPFEYYRSSVQSGMPVVVGENDSGDLVAKFKCTESNDFVEHPMKYHGDKYTIVLDEVTYMSQLRPIGQTLLPLPDHFDWQVAHSSTIPVELPAMSHAPSGMYWNKYKEHDRECIQILNLLDAGEFPPIYEPRAYYRRKIEGLQQPVTIGFNEFNILVIKDQKYNEFPMKYEDGKYTIYDHPALISQVEVKATKEFPQDRDLGIQFIGDDLKLAKIEPNKWAEQCTELQDYTEKEFAGWRITKINGTEMSTEKEFEEFKNSCSSVEPIIFTLTKIQKNFNGKARDNKNSEHRWIAESACDGFASGATPPEKLCFTDGAAIAEPVILERYSIEPTVYEFPSVKSPIARYRTGQFKRPVTVGFNDDDVLVAIFHDSDIQYRLKYEDGRYFYDRKRGSKYLCAKNTVTWAAASSQDTLRPDMKPPEKLVFMPVGGFGQPVDNTWELEPDFTDLERFPWPYVKTPLAHYRRGKPKKPITIGYSEKNELVIKFVDDEQEYPLEFENGKYFYEKTRSKYHVNHLTQTLADTKVKWETKDLPPGVIDENSFRRDLEFKPGNVLGSEPSKWIFCSDSDADHEAQSRHEPSSTNVADMFSEEKDTEGLQTTAPVDDSTKTDSEVAAPKPRKLKRTNIQKIEPKDGELRPDPLPEEIITILREDLEEKMNSHGTLSPEDIEYIQTVFDHAVSFDSGVSDGEISVEDLPETLKAKNISKTFIKEIIEKTKTEILVQALGKEGEPTSEITDIEKRKEKVWQEATFHSYDEDGLPFVIIDDEKTKAAYAESSAISKIHYDEGYQEWKRKSMSKDSQSGFIQLELHSGNEPIVTYLVKSSRGVCQCEPGWTGARCNIRIGGAPICPTPQDSTTMWIVFVGMMVVFGIVLGCLVVGVVRFVMSRRRSLVLEDFAALVKVLKKMQIDEKVRKKKHYQKFIQQQNVSTPTGHQEVKTFLPALQEPFKVPCFQIPSSSPTSASSSAHDSPVHGPFIRPLETENNDINKKTVIDNATIPANPFITSSFGRFGAEACYKDLPKTTPPTTAQNSFASCDGSLEKSEEEKLEVFQGCVKEEEARRHPRCGRDIKILLRGGTGNFHVHALKSKPKTSIKQKWLDAPKKVSKLKKSCTAMF